MKTTQKKQTKKQFCNGLELSKILEENERLKQFNKEILKQNKMIQEMYEALENGTSNLVKEYEDLEIKNERLKQNYLSNDGIINIINKINKLNEIEKLKSNICFLGNSNQEYIQTLSKMQYDIIKGCIK